MLVVNLGLSQAQLSIIPQPKMSKSKEGAFLLTKETVIQADSKLFETQFLQKSIAELTGFKLKIVTESKSSNKISLRLNKAMNENFYKDQYTLSINNDFIQIQSADSKGIFYGIQSFLQMLPTTNQSLIKLPFVEIIDKPKYAWRGMHLDCARHFFPKEFIKKYIDYLAMYKMNTFHWHLTDDQGWRIEIKKYPRLTDVGAWRNGSMVGHYNDQKFDDKKYGGFYTQEDIKEIVAYANERHITIVPEIEMPGHAQAALSAFLQFSCTGKPIEVAKQWGVLDDVFCPKDETFAFLEDVLTEVIALFPSQYIHVGGDECPKTRWKNCSHCQNLIKEKGLKDEHELQSYFVQRIEKFVNSKGRKIIGWDEILEGGLAPNAAVMSWRGTEGGIAAAKQKHYVVMSPGSHCYFDHYQGEPKNEPLAIGGYTPVEKVYSFNPTPKELSLEESKYILGAQANLWTEYIETPQHVEYMIFPRIMALSEVLWGTSKPDQYKEFQDRMIQQFPLLEKKNINYSKSIFEVTTQVSPSQSGKGIAFTLKSANDSSKIRFTTDGSNPTIDSFSYSYPIEINKSMTVKAAYFDNGRQKSATVEQKFFWSNAVGKKITLVNQPHENYSNGGAFTLIDGLIGNRTKFGRDWLGFSGKDMNATIDLGKSETINKVILCVLENQGSWIYYPKSIELLISSDGQNFKSVKQLSLTEIQDVKGEVVLEVQSLKAQFIKVIATNMGKIPDGFPGAGADAWLFVDEIGVE